MNPLKKLFSIFLLIVFSTQAAQADIRENAIVEGVLFATFLHIFKASPHKSFVLSLLGASTRNFLAEPNNNPIENLVDASALSFSAAVTSRILHYLTNPKKKAKKNKFSA